MYSELDINIFLMLSYYHIIISQILSIYYKYLDLHNAEINIIYNIIYKYFLKNSLYILEGRYVLKSY